MTRPNKRYVVQLELEERARLERRVSVGKRAAAKLTHARVLLQADQSAAGRGWTDARIAEGLGVTTRTVENLRRRFVEQGLQAALERKKQCRPSRERLLAEIRRGPWKLVLASGELYQLERDVGERWNRADRHPELVAQLRDIATRHDAAITADARPVGRVQNPLWNPEQRHRRD